MTVRPTRLMSPARATTGPAAGPIALAFGLNLAWELTHGRLYARDIPTWMYLRAAGVDATLIAAAMSLARRSERGFWTVLVGWLLLIAIGIEVWALSIGRWSYTDSMPTVGTLGVSPLVQLPLTGVVTALVARSADRPSNDQGP